MTITDKRNAALAALDHHARRYKVSIPDRIRAFYAGDFDRYHLKYVTAKVASWGHGTFQLALTPPSWLNKGDDAVNGPRGDWKDAGNYLPLFVGDSDLYLVVNLVKPGCPTGWYHEEEHSYRGPSAGADSLDAFLAGMTADPPLGSKERSEDDRNGVNRPLDPDVEHEWSEDFGDDGPRVFDLAD